MLILCIISGICFSICLTLLVADVVTMTKEGITRESINAFIWLLVLSIIFGICFYVTKDNYHFTKNMQVKYLPVKIDYMKQYPDKIILIINGIVLEKTHFKWLNTNSIIKKVKYYKNKTNFEYVVKKKNVKLIDQFIDSDNPKHSYLYTQIIGKGSKSTHVNWIEITDFSSNKLIQVMSNELLKMKNKNNIP